MRQEQGKVVNRRDLDEDLELHGMWAGDCVVRSGARLVLHGMVAGDLTVEDGATAQLHGTVTGALRALGRVDVFGMVSGGASGGGVVLHPGAMVHGRT